VASRRRLVIAALAALLIFASGCSTTGATSAVVGDIPNGTTDTANSSDGTLFVGSVASLTGSGEPYGVSQADGTLLAVEFESESSDYPISIESLDDGSDVDRGVAAFGSLIEQGASVILGPTLSPVAIKADPLAQAVGVPVLAVTNTTLDISTIGDAVWRITLSERAMLPQGLAAAQQLRGVRTAVLLFDSTDTYATGAAEAFRAAADQVGVTLVDDVGFDPTTLDAGGYQALIGAADAQRPDALLLAARSQPAVELLRTIAAAGLTQTIIGSNGFNSAEVLTQAGEAANGLIVTASWNADIDVDASRMFVRRFTARYQREPDTFAAQSYAGIQVLVAAAAAGAGTSRQAIVEGLTRLDTVDTVVGTIRFSNNEAVYPAAVQVVTDGRFELLTRGTP
jgi:branched-chain amino acid transport system substrate-binding protein